MIVVFALGSYALLLALVIPKLLTAGSLAERAPRLTVALWQASTFSLLVTSVLAGIALAVPSVSMSGGLADLLTACFMAIRAQYATAEGMTFGIIGMSVATLVLTRAVGVLLLSLASATRDRRRHSEVLAVVGVRNGGGFTVLKHDVAAAYCIAARGGQVVLTSGALNSLAQNEVRAVVAHENAHLRGHHHIAIDFAAAMDRAFPWVPLFRVAAVEISRLVELLADDAASRQVNRSCVATALVRLAAGPTPTAALAASGPNALTRVRRMLAPARPLSLASTALIAVIGFTLLTAPVMIATQPAFAAHQMRLCPVKDLAYASPTLG